MYCWINQMHLKSLSIMDLIFYPKCLSPHLPAVTGKGDPKSQIGNVSFLLHKEQVRHNYFSGILCTAAWRWYGINASSRGSWLVYMNPAIENSVKGVLLSILTKKKTPNTPWYLTIMHFRGIYNLKRNDETIFCFNCTWMIAIQHNLITVGVIPQFLRFSTKN